MQLKKFYDKIQFEQIKKSIQTRKKLVKQANQLYKKYEYTNQLIKNTYNDLINCNLDIENYNDFFKYYEIVNNKNEKYRVSNVFLNTQNKKPIYQVTYIFFDKKSNKSLESIMPLRKLLIILNNNNFKLKLIK